MLLVLCRIREGPVAATKVELFERIRRDSWREGLSVRALARKYGVHRRLVREALTRAEPAPRKKPVRRSPQLEPFKEIIDGWLRADLDAPRKQRHTVRRIHARLIEEHDAVGMSYSALRDYVARRRPEIRIEEGRGPAQVFVPQHHPPGQDAEALDTFHQMEALMCQWQKVYALLDAPGPFIYSLTRTTLRPLPLG
jgi:transposase-like protein